MTRYAAGLFTVRRLDEPLVDILERIADLGYEGVEFVDRMDWEIDQRAVRETLDRTGLEPVGAHAWLHQLEDEMDTLADRYGPLGVDTFVVPYHPETNFRNRRRMRELADRLLAVSEKARDRGFDLSYHPNHWDLVPMFDGPILGNVPSLRITEPESSVSQDLVLQRRENESRLAGLGRGVENEILRRRNTLFDRVLMASGAVTDNDARTLVRETPLGYLIGELDPEDVSIQLDISFFIQQGYDPAELLSHIGHQVASIHAKDVRTDQYTPGGWPSFVDAGEGDADFGRLVEAAEENDIEWIIFENGHAEDALGSLEGGIETLRAAGRRRVGA